MENKFDHDRILLSNPWIFRNSWLVIKPWDRETDIRSLDFDHVSIWVQLWGLPNHCKTKQMGESLGALLGNVEAVKFHEYPGKHRILKIKVAINVHYPIQTGIHVGNPTDGTTWIDFRYEKLPHICYNCGHIGHAENLCYNTTLETGNTIPLGPWIRSTQYGRRVLEAKEKQYYSNPSQAKSYGRNNPPAPEALIQQLADMKINQATPMDATKGHQHSRFQTNNGIHTAPKAIKGVTMQITTVNTNLQGSSSSSSKRQRTEDLSPLQSEMAGPAQQASQQP